MDKRKYWLGLINLQGLGPRIIKNLLDYFGDAEAIWKASQTELCKVKLIGKKRSQHIIKDREKINLDYKLERIEKVGVKYITLADEDYPFLLKKIYDPPPVIFYKGELSFQDLISLSIVGSRKCTAYGRKVANRLAASLADQGFTIVSGLARGIDTSAHQGSLKYGRTIAVLGSGIDVIYPPENDELVTEIEKSGAVISSFPLGTAPHGNNFPQRNRIISGLSLGTIVVEAAKKSGSLITANLALNQGREVFAIPGDITKDQSIGTNSLIQTGAKLVQTIDDILTELPLDSWLEVIGKTEKELKEETKIDLSSQEAEVYDKIKSNPQEFDKLLDSVNFSASQLNSILLKLEIKGLIIQLSGNRFKLKR
ncbi:DNA-processing protein DprA [Sporohalobacter salinus]|uniref:DNA-processing protein DprA n=1 Tax=Sporohalobacter salinus TaxID=1494606 RepID=UPI0019614DF9|nr:DNA-processing protein DprA [Sporohalobacter salinus]MBM7623534.1 DNA processing protein [Sporohalobacter salinus]